jgi:hypothetical protein
LIQVANLRENSVKEGAHMHASSRQLRTLATLVVSCSLACAGCAALIAYCGEDVGKLANKDKVHESFGTPTNTGMVDGREFEEYHTRRKISEPNGASACLMVSAGSLGLFELFMFPVAICQTTASSVFGQDVRFEYGSNGEVERILINGKPTESGLDLQLR